MKILNKVIFWSYSVLVFFVPLFFTPWNFELFQFNKMVLVYLLTIIILWSWITKSIISKKFIFKQTFWDIPLILFLFSQIISTIFSIDPHTSIFGYYSRFNGGLISTLCYLTLYWAAVSNLNKEKTKKIITFGLAGGLIVAVYGIAQHFGIDKDYWVQDVQRRVFSTLGQPNWLAAYLNILIFLTIRHPECNEGSPQNKKSKGILHSLNAAQNDAVFYLLFSIFYITLLFTKSRSGFLGFIIPFGIWLIHNVWTGHNLSLQNKKLKKTAFITLLTISLSILIGIPFSFKDKLNISFLSDIPSSPPATSYQLPATDITPSSDIRKIVWQGAIKLWHQKPVIGTGVETFGYSYYWVRPKKHNLTSEWNFLYNKAHNEYLNYAATTGTLGLATYLILIFTAFIFAIRNSLGSIFYILCSLIITNFFGFSTVTTSFFFYFLPGLYWILNKNPKFQIPDSNFSYKLKSKQLLLLFTNTLIAIVLLTAAGRYWLADFFYAKGEKYAEIDLLNTAEDYYSTAIKLNPLEPNFYSDRGVLYAKLAAYYSQNNQEEKSQKLVQTAVNNCLKALDISPYHLNFYKNHTMAHYYLAVYDLELLNNAVEMLKQAQELAPTDPKIPFNIAQIYQTLDENNKAKEYYQKALDLKPNYEKAAAAIEKL